MIIWGVHCQGFSPTLSLKLKLACILLGSFKCWFLRRGENRSNPEKDLSEQSREPTNSAHIWRRIRESILEHIGGRRMLSPLRHPCSPSNLNPNKPNKHNLFHYFRKKKQKGYRTIINFRLTVIFPKQRDNINKLPLKWINACR